MSHLVSYYSQIEPNLRRTADKGLISLLNQRQLEDLAFKYFGIKDEYGNIIGYQCPYSGKIYTDYEDIVLEHIVPVVSKGGTVLFNCIPTSKEVNGAAQKGAKHLITWWIKSKYWNQEAPLRLEKIVNYMLDAYDQVFKEYTIEEVESSYLDIEIDESALEEEDNLEYSETNESKLLKQAKNNGIHSYLGFILNCINTLENKEICNIDTTNIRRKLTELQDNHIFEDIERYQLFQNTIQKLIVSRIGDDNHSYLTYSLNFDIKKLMDLIKSNNPEEIYNELNTRLQNIEQLLKQNNLSTIEYFKSLKDIQNIDIIYKNNISEEEINIFLENIKIGIDTKIDIFIEMLNNGNSTILKQGNKETLEGYSNINLSFFWSRYKDRIIKKIFEELKDNPKYEVARRLIDINEMTINLDKKILIFIDMLNEGNYNILKKDNKEKLKGYPNIKLAKFWSNHKERIKQKLFVELKDTKYDTPRQLIAQYEVENNIDKKIENFINMLNEGNINILKNGNKTTLDGYPNVKLTTFWSNHKDKIIHKLFIELKDNPKYDVARKLIDINEITINVDKQIPIFINMLNEGNHNILKYDNKETLKGYPNIKLARFWSKHQDRIKQKLFIELKDNMGYEKAREFVKINEMTINVDKQIPIFINMLNQGKSNILIQNNKETLENYPGIKLAHFWTNNKDRILYKLFVELKDNSKYDIARNIIEGFNVSNNIGTKIEIFINMLNEKNDRILKNRNTETLKGYPNVKLSRFWSKHQDRIKQKLFVELKDNPEYNTARQTVLTYFNVKTYEELEDKSKKENQLKEDKKIKKELEETIKYLDEVNLTEQEQRKRA